MLLAVVASVLLYFLDTRLDYFKPVRATLSTVVYPVQKLASMPDDFVTWFSELFQGHQQLREKIMTLEAQNLTNSVRMQK
ncbi:MAG TPA: rod shape-determining protein MreC, partial [Methylophaga sp.]|nr:rod shape-determining protein MreC [Methylophaga sp.]